MSESDYIVLAIIVLVVGAIAAGLWAAARGVKWGAKFIGDNPQVVTDSLKAISSIAPLMV